MSSPAHDYAAVHADHFRAELHDLLRIPSISTLPERAPDVIHAAEWVAESMRRVGIEHVALMPTAGHPVVYGDWLHAGPGAPTVLIYGHYDVQPADIEDGWTHPPFKPIERDGRIFARGAVDDKGQVFIHIKAIESIMQTRGSLPANVKFVIEGEEEIGSPNLPAFVRQHKDLLRADVCLISDTGIISIDQPSIVYALRGLVGMDIIVRGPARDLHSGSYGGAVHNPIQALTEILAQLHNPDGSISVPGFYDDVLPLTDDERRTLKDTAMSSDQLIKETGVSRPWGEPDYEINERIGARPTLEINGIGGGFQGKGVKTVLPAQAMAKITCRLVAHQVPARIIQCITDYIQRLAPDSVTVEINPLPGDGAPVLVALDNPAIQTAVKAYEKVWGKKVVFQRGGGTLPIVPVLQHELNLPVVLMGFGLPGDGAHGPDESFNIQMFHRGIDTIIHFLQDIPTALTV